MGRSRLFSAVLLAFALCNSASAQPIAPGEYIRSGDSGVLKIERQHGQTSFSLETTGANCHSCSMSGQIKGRYAQTDDESGDASAPSCRVRLTPSHQGQWLDLPLQNGEACLQHCGARAHIGGTYRKPPAHCSRTGQRKARDTFIAHYRTKQYPQAVAALSPVLEQCGDFLDWIEADRIRNDLALAHFHAGNPARCLKLLQDTRASSQANEQGLKGEIPPCDYDNYIATARATWHNMSLCKGSTGR